MAGWKSLAFLLLAGPAFAIQGKSPVIKVAKKQHVVISEYLRLHHSYEKMVCPAGTEEKFNTLFKNYRGDGHYVPLLEDDSLDKKTIQKFLPKLREKKAWIDGLVADVENLPNLNAPLAAAKGLEDQLQALLVVKEAYYETTSPERKKEMALSTRKGLDSLEWSFHDFAKLVPFLLGFDFPVDFLDLRSRYDKVKVEKGEKARALANEVYFLRKILEDGAQNPDTTRQDTYLRAAISTVAIELKARPEVVDENLRFDLTSVLKSIQQHLSDGKDRQVDRLKEWQARIERTIVFYEGLLKGKVVVEGRPETGIEYLVALSEARAVLKKFIQDRQVMSYKFWAQQSELMQALFALETILYNEVGQLDGREALERKDIAQVVVNRRFNPNYNSLKEGDDFLRALKSAGVSDQEIQKHIWPNLLFKEGEFSFTYFFIPSTIRSFCAEQTNTGKFLRRENLKIALRTLQHPRYAFKAERYFSRGAMLGRIDMTSIWSGYSAISERPGPKSQRSTYLEAEYRAGRYKYWYHFQGTDGKMYKVVEIKSAPYAMPVGGKGMFKYRNPHQFKYFQNIQTLPDFASQLK